MPPNLGGFFMVRSYYPSECHADYFDFERIEALKPAIEACGISTLSQSPMLGFHKQMDNRIKLLEEILSFRMQGVEFDNGDMYVDGHKAASDVRDEFVSVTEKLMDELAQCYNVLPQRSEERFSRNAETDLVCRLLLEKKNKSYEFWEYARHVVLLHYCDQWARRGVDGPIRRVSFRVPTNTWSRVRR